MKSGLCVVRVVWTSLDFDFLDFDFFFFFQPQCKVFNITELGGIPQMCKRGRENSTSSNLWWGTVVQSTFLVLSLMSLMFVQVFQITSSCFVII